MVVLEQQNYKCYFPLCTPLSLCVIKFLSGFSRKQLAFYPKPNTEWILRFSLCLPARHPTQSSAPQCWVAASAQRAGEADMIFWDSENAWYGIIIEETCHYIFVKMDIMPNPNIDLTINCGFMSQLNINRGHRWEAPSPWAGSKVMRTGSSVLSSPAAALTRESRSCILPGQHSGTGSGGVGPGELALRA